MRCTDFNAALLRSDLHLLSKSRRSKLPDGVNDHPCRKSVFRKSSTESSAQGESSARRSGRHIWFADANPRGVCPAERPRGIGPEKREPSERLNDTQPMATGQKEDSERAAEAPNPSSGATTSKSWKQRETASLYLCSAPNRGFSLGFGAFAPTSTVTRLPLASSRSSSILPMIAWMPSETLRGRCRPFRAHDRPAGIGSANAFSLPAVG